MITSRSIQMSKAIATSITTLDSVQSYCFFICFEQLILDFVGLSIIN